MLFAYAKSSTETAVEKVLLSGSGVMCFNRSDDTPLAPHIRRGSRGVWGGRSGACLRLF